MIVRDISFPTAKENLLFDDVLLYMAETDITEDVLRFWESPEDFIVLGRVGKEKEDVRAEEALRDGVKVFRRSSGGGTVVQGQGCLNYSLILSKEPAHINDLRQSYAFILGNVVSALVKLNIQAQFLPISDIALVEGQKKISGNAQKRGRKYILHHGTILYQFDLNKITQYLRMPQDIPAYRQGRNHMDFVANVNVSAEKLKQEIARTFKTYDVSHHVSIKERKLLDEFVATKDIEVKLQ
jgi:lipoate---protein ligase